MIFLLLKWILYLYIFVFFLKHIVLFFVFQYKKTYVRIGTIAWYNFSLHNVHVEREDICLKFKTVALQLRFFNPQQAQLLQFNVSEVAVENKYHKLEEPLLIDVASLATNEIVRNVTKEVLKSLRSVIQYTAVNLEFVRIVFQNSKDSVERDWRIVSEIRNLKVHGQRGRILSVDSDSVKVNMYHGGRYNIKLGEMDPDNIAMELDTSIHLVIGLDTSDWNVIHSGDIAVDSLNVTVYPEFKDLLSKLESRNADGVMSLPQSGDLPVALICSALAPKQTKIKLENVKVAYLVDSTVGPEMSLELQSLEVKCRKTEDIRNPFNVAFEVDSLNIISQIPLAECLVKMSTVAQLFSSPQSNDLILTDNRNTIDHNSISGVIKGFRIRSMVHRSFVDLSTREARINGGNGEFKMAIDGCEIDFRNKAALRMDTIDVFFKKHGHKSGITCKVAHKSFVDLNLATQSELKCFFNKLAALQFEQSGPIVETESESSFYWKIAVDGAFKLMLEHNLTEGEILTDFLFISWDDEFRARAEKTVIIKSNELTATINDFLYANGAVQWADIKYRNLRFIASYYESFLNCNVDVLLPRSFWGLITGVGSILYLAIVAVIVNLFGHWATFIKRILVRLI